MRHARCYSTPLMSTRAIRQRMRLWRGRGIVVVRYRRRWPPWTIRSTSRRTCRRRLPRSTMLVCCFWPWVGRESVSTFGGRSRDTADALAIPYYARGHPSKEELSRLDHPLRAALSVHDVPEEEEEEDEDYYAVVARSLLSSPLPPPAAAAAAESTPVVFDPAIFSSSSSSTPTSPTPSPPHCAPEGATRSTITCLAVLCYLSCVGQRPSSLQQ